MLTDYHFYPKMHQNMFSTGLYTQIRLGNDIA